MFFLWGWRVWPRMLGVALAPCECSEEPTTKVEFRRWVVMTVFFIPLLPVGWRRWSVCDRCGATYPAAKAARLARRARITRERQRAEGASVAASTAARSPQPSAALPPREQVGPLLGEDDRRSLRALADSMPAKLEAWAPQAPTEFPDGTPTRATVHLAVLSTMVQAICLDARTVEDADLAIILVRTMARIADAPHVLPTLGENDEVAFARTRLAARSPHQLLSFDQAVSVLTHWWACTGAMDDFARQVAAASTVDQVRAINEH